MRVKLINILYIVFCIIGLIVAYIYFNWDLSSFHKNILSTINYSIASIVGCLTFIEAKFFSENHKKLGEKFFGIVLLITSLSRIFFIWI
ncbi:hypothetical protein [Clostridium brassicae]|uniref:Uncharacterized protein n=1 Tax=Clostridium brassicae TaxID=2999072 RepID=A0ABT4D624_9CLOT|nr:hypothetical protein [Clostridium brassicae]MCY6957746.1 hypothetical protein [Clostridium brassicae]